jgi:MurNAc alpha-1-phosphate uridylyltransferase
MTPRTAMALAAGLGTRMRPLTVDRPKALVEVGGRSLLERVLDRLDEAGIERVVVNLHHLGEMIQTRLETRTRPAISFSRERVLLETGGGVLKALPLLGAAPFFVTSTDVVWSDGAVPTFERLAQAWREDAMDALLLLYPAAGALGYSGPGDFLMDRAGRLARRPQDGEAPYLFTTVQLLHPRLFAGLMLEPFSLNRVYDRAIEAGRLYGMVHDGLWAHVGTPDSIEPAARLLAGTKPERALR